MNIFENEYYHNSLQIWLIAVSITVFSFLILKIVVGFVKNRLKKLADKTASKVDDVIVIILEKTIALFLLSISIFIAVHVLTLNENIFNIINKSFFLVFLIQTAIWGNALISFYIKSYTDKKKEVNASATTTMSTLSFIGKLLLYTALVLIGLDNLGFNITTLIAGLGVGGIAIALAVQNILGDLFASLSIVFDKPFVIGDFIIIDNYLGTVEHVGLKTTRIRSLSGEQVVIANNDLLSSRIRNYKRMYERRVVFNIGVIYQTSQEQLEKIPKIIKDIIDKQDRARFDRSHFKGFGNFSLDFETVFWVKLADYNIYMDIQQIINLGIINKFREENIEFAYPTQMIYTDKQLSDSNQK
jgi:small-conductance mechanosensitive channel